MGRALLYDEWYTVDFTEGSAAWINGVCTGVIIGEVSRNKSGTFFHADSFHGCFWNAIGYGAKFEIEGKIGWGLFNELTPSILKPGSEIQLRDFNSRVYQPLTVDIRENLAFFRLRLVYYKNKNLICKFGWKRKSGWRMPMKVKTFTGGFTWSLGEKRGYFEKTTEVEYLEAVWATL